MKGDRKYIVILSLVFLAFILIEYYQPQPVDWRPSFSKSDKIPYGDYIIYDFLPDIFPGKNVSVTTMPAYNSLPDSDSVESNYVIINEQFYPDSLDIKKLLGYVASGNNVFITAKDFSDPFSDSLKVKTSVDFSIDYNAKDSLSLNFEQDAYKSPDDFKYRKGTVDYYFINYDTAHTTVLGKNSKNEPDYIRIKHGAGSFYISTVPYAFTNYNALKGKNAGYISRALSYLPVANVLWDEYYKVNKSEAGTPLRFILSNAALMRAYYILIFGLILYVIFEGKRKQRVIPVIKPLQNTSLEFVETIGMLYYQKGTNLAIAKKKIQFFLDVIRSKYNIGTSAMNEEFYDSLSQITGVALPEIKNLFTFIVGVNYSESIDDAELFKLNNMIEDFYQKTI